MVILGSTGSIGTQALDVVAAAPERFRVVGLTAGGSQPEVFAEQVRRFGPAYSGLCEEASVEAPFSSTKPPPWKNTTTGSAFEPASAGV